MLQKNFARGAFGEIWLAVKRSCLKEDMGEGFFPVHNASQQTNFSESQRSGYFPRGQYCSKHPSSGGWPAGYFRHGDTFILKRIMVFSIIPGFLCCVCIVIFPHTTAGFFLGFIR
jgi:hypothetical protein